MIPCGADGSWQRSREWRGAEEPVQVFLPVQKTAAPFIRAGNAGFRNCCSDYLAQRATRRLEAAWVDGRADRCGVSVSAAWHLEARAGLLVPSKRCVAGGVQNLAAQAPSLWPAALPGGAPMPPRRRRAVRLPRPLVPIHPQPLPKSNTWEAKSVRARFFKGCSSLGCCTSSISGTNSPSLEREDRRGDG